MHHFQQDLGDSCVDLAGYSWLEHAIDGGQGSEWDGRRREKSESIKALKASTHSEDITQYKTKTSYNKIEMKFRYRVSVHVIGK